MNFEKTSLAGVVEIGLQPNHDERGFFARCWCQREFELQGLDCRMVQCNVSHNEQKGTLRGLHYQAAPFGEAKLIRCTAGSIYDVALDLRPQSPTFKQWFGTILSANNHLMLFIPEGCAHGFLTLEHKTEVFYQMSEFYHPDSARGVRWNDPAFQIKWPGRVDIISERERNYPDFQRL